MIKKKIKYRVLYFIKNIYLLIAILTYLGIFLGAVRFGEVGPFFLLLFSLYYYISYFLLDFLTNLFQIENNYYNFKFPEKISFKNNIKQSIKYILIIFFLIFIYHIYFYTPRGNFKGFKNSYWDNCKQIFFMEVVSNKQ